MANPNRNHNFYFVGVHCMNPINSNVGVDPCVNPNKKIKRAGIFTPAPQSINTKGGL